MMLAINESIEALRSIGLPIPNWISAIIFVVIILAIVLKSLTTIINFFKNIGKDIETYFYDRETKQFVELRNTFVEHLDSEVKRLNREADWNDFHYTELEAEVEVDPSLDLDILHSRNPIVWLYSLFHLIQNSIGITPALKVQKNLIQAIMHSKSRAFLIIGDPGSGKTVSLRHLFIEMAKRCTSSKDKAAVVPIYLNLKHLNIEPNEVDANRIHNWVIEQLRADQDRTIHEFLDKNFEQMLKDGAFFFLFDSFDEIPAVMDAQEEQEVVHQYATSLDRFLHSQHQSRGLVSSRPYRAPRTFIGQRMTIRPLSSKHIEKALYRYMGQELTLADQLWQELVQSREDMLYIAQNPFYLGLLARYSKENQRLPDRHYDLFEHFVQKRARTDEERLRAFGLTSNQLIERASILAFAMTRTPHIGLESDTCQVREITSDFDEISGWDTNKAEPLLHALAYSKIGRISQEEPGKPRSFSFVHRRFHEYFCARYLKQNPNSAPFENLAADDRWREVLVLLCEVIPSDYLTRIFDTARLALTVGITANSGSIEHRKAIETIRFLRDGFHNRIDDIPNDIRILCSRFIQKQLKAGTLLDQKRAIEGVSIADNESVNSILESALTSDSAWLRETAIRSCRILKSISQQIAVAIRQHFYRRYADLKIHNDHAFYSVLFSSPPALHQFKSFLNILTRASLIQVLFYMIIVIYGFTYDIGIPIGFFIGLLITVLFIFIQSTSIFRSKSDKPLLDLSRYSLLDFEPLFDRYFEPLTKSITNILLRNTWSFVALSMLYAMLLPFAGREHLFDIMPILIFVFFINIFLASLASDYPNSIWDWFLYPLRILVKIVRALKVLLLESLLDRGFIKLLLFLGLVWGSIFWVVKAIDFALAQNLSINNIYLAYGFVLATFILLTILFGIIVSIFAIGFSLKIILQIILEFGRIIRDQSKLTKLSIISENRPKTGADAIQILRLFKSDVGKTQYIHALSKWLPIGADPQVLIEEANKHTGTVRDKLYQLAEVWEDSMRRDR